QRIDYVTAVKLTDRQQIPGRGQQADPGRAGDGVQIDVRTRHTRKNQLFEQPQQRWNPVAEGAFISDSGNDLRVSQANRKRRKQEDESGERPSHSDVE